jgi:hypothetical protein
MSQCFDLHDVHHVMASNDVALQIKDVAESSAENQGGRQNGVSNAPADGERRGQESATHGKLWQPPERSAARGTRVALADIDLNSLQYIGALSHQP